MSNPGPFRLTVVGRPRPWSGGVGNRRIFPSTQTEQWQRLVRREVEAEMARTGHPGFGKLAVTAVLCFSYARPKKTIYPDRPRIADLDKLVRPMLDALTQAGLIADDSHVVDVVARKTWDEGGDGSMSLVVFPSGLAETDGQV